MLVLDFINVGNGDSILVREMEGERLRFSMLVDCGHDSLERDDHPPVEDPRSCRIFAGDFLRSQGVAHLDILLVTHFHRDHIGGLGRVLETAWRKGAKLDAWEEYFSLDRWLEAFDQCGLDPHFYANRTREKDELMPWAMISSGVTESYLWRERERAFAGVTTPDCRTHCNACGANRLVGGKCDV